MAHLEQTLKPILPQLSAKLVSDLLATGMAPAKIAKVIGRKPTYVHAIASGERALSAQQIVKLIRHASVKRENVQVPEAVQEAHDDVSQD